MRLFASVALLVGGCSGESRECADADKILVFADNDRDGFGIPGTQKPVCPPVNDRGEPTGEVPRGFSSNDDDCDDLRSEINPGAIEACDGFDNDCDGEADEGLRAITFYLDGDGDGYGSPDLDEAIAACGAPPGFVDNLDDCDDANAAIRPDAVEICDNGVDNNCDNRSDDDDFAVDPLSAPTWYFDGDGDSFGTPDNALQSCLAPGLDWVQNPDDCDDDAPRVNPSQEEVCNRIDDDCDLFIDDSDSDIDPDTQSLWFADDDNDGFGNPDVTTLACFQPWFHVANDRDCNDDEPLLGLPAQWVLDNDNDGFGAGPPSAAACVGPTPDWVLLAFGVDCDDTNPLTSPLGNEVCDGDDNDCDLLIDDADPSLDPAFSNQYWRDADNDTYGDEALLVQACSRPNGYATNDQDCNDGDRFVNPGASEVCDNQDNDCDDLVDDADPNVDLGSAGTWYLDSDEDGFGNAAVSVDACTQPTFYVDNDLDCDDTDEDQLVFGPWVVDDDADGVGAGAQSPSDCEAPLAGWVPTYFGDDCDNADPTRYPGNFEICNNGNDEDCDGFDPPCAFAPPGFEGVQADSGPESGPYRLQQMPRDVFPDALQIR